MTSFEGARSGCKCHAVAGEGGVPEGGWWKAGGGKQSVPAGDDIEQFGDMEEVGFGGCAVFGAHTALGQLVDGVVGEVHAGDGDGCEGIGAHPAQE